jgi:exopolyphosphatase/pppGpp-phosphohydrolase
MNFKHPLAENPDKAFTHAVRLFRKAFDSKPLKTGWPVLVGGTALALAHLESGMKVFDPESVEGCRLTADGLRDWVRLMRNLSRAELESLQGLDAGRSEILVPGLVLAMAMAEASEVKGFVLSARGLRYGLLLEGARRMGAPTLTDAVSEKVI